MQKTSLDRIYHPWWKWECYKSGFYNTTPPEGMDKESAELQYCSFLSDLNKFGAAMERVMKEWPHSCDQFLSNPGMNRIAWLGQASVCITTGVPSCFRAGFKLLEPHAQDAANALAAEYLDKWLRERNEHKN